MKRLVLVPVVVVTLVLASCGGDATATTTTTTVPETTQPETGMAVVQACIEAMNAVADGIDLDADDAMDQLDEALGLDGPEECAFFADGPESIGLTEAEVFTALAEGLNPQLFELMTTPTVEPFEHTADEL